MHKQFEIMVLSRVPHHMRTDYETRNRNLLDLFMLCGWCDGTGNEFMSMFSLCPVCGGTGRSPVKGLLTAGGTR